MSFTLAQITNHQAEDVLRLICPTGKHPFATKREARDRATRHNRRERTNMNVFRCGYCDRYHLGHKRGAIL